MNAKHTPAPWSINDWPQADSSIAIGAVGTPLIARIILRDVSINEQKANAHLVAKAPELLAILKNILESLRDYNEVTWSELAAARAFVAELEGP